MAQTRNYANSLTAAIAADAVPDSFDLQSTAADNTAGVGTCPREFVGIGGNTFCGDLLAATNTDVTPGVITCNYRYCKAANSKKPWLGAPPLKF